MQWSTIFNILGAFTFGFTVKWSYLDHLANLSACLQPVWLTTCFSFLVVPHGTDVAVFQELPDLSNYLDVYNDIITYNPKLQNKTQNMMNKLGMTRTRTDQMQILKKIY